MFKLIVLFGFMVLFIVLWSWILSNDRDYTPPPGRI